MRRRKEGERKGEEKDILKNAKITVALINRKETSTDMNNGKEGC